MDGTAIEHFEEDAWIPPPENFQAGWVHRKPDVRKIVPLTLPGRIRGLGTAVPPMPGA